VSGGQFDWGGRLEEGFFRSLRWGLLIVISEWKPTICWKPRSLKGM